MFTQLSSHPRNRRPRKALAILLVIVLSTSALAFSNDDRCTDTPEYHTYVPADTFPFVPGQIVIKFSGDAEPSGELADLLDSTQISKLQSGQVYLLQFDPTTNPVELSGRLQTKQGIAYCHPNYILDSLHGVQGSRPIGDEEGNYFSYFYQPAGTVLELSSAHRIATGEGVKVGIIDCGVSNTHPVFTKPFAPGYDFVDEDTEPIDEPGGLISGHGTFVAGLIQWVAPDAELAPYRIMNSNGYGNGFNMARAIERAVYDGCNVINISAVLVTRHRAVSDAVGFAETQGVTIVAAAGNDAITTPTYPAAEREVIAVAGIDSTYRPADFTNYGDYIDVCAPSVNLYSAYSVSDDSLYGWWSGTSFASPCVSGQVALIAGILPNLKSELRDTVISSTCWDLEAKYPEYDGQLGYGLMFTSDAVIFASIKNTILNVLPGTTDYAAAIPDRFYFRVERDCDVVRIVRPWICSSNAPSFFSAEVLPGGGGFTSIPSIYQTGSTNDSVEIFIHPDFTAEEGSWVDTVMFTVDGISRPAMVEIFLEKPGPCLSVADSAEVIAIDGYDFTFEVGGDAVDTACFEVRSTNAPATFYVGLVDPEVSFIDLDTRHHARFFEPLTGQTNSTFCIPLDGRRLLPGTYLDSMAVYVEGVDNGKILLCLTVEILSKNSSGMLGNFPNPFNPSTTIFFSLDEPAEVELVVYNILGQEVTCLVSRWYDVGEYQVVWDGNDSRGNPVGSGVYFYRLRTGQQSQTRKMILLK